MKIFLAIFVFACAICIGQSVFVREAINNINIQNRYMAEKEGDVYAFIARRKFGNNLIVGKYIKEWNTVYLPFHGKEHQFKDDFEVFRTNGQYEWVRFPGHIPSNAIEGGYEGTRKLYIGRKFHDGKHLLGKIAEGFHSVYVPYFNKEIEFNDNFDILVKTPNHQNTYLNNNKFGNGK